MSWWERSSCADLFSKRGLGLGTFLELSLRERVLVEELRMDRGGWGVLFHAHKCRKK